MRTTRAERSDVKLKPFPPKNQPFGPLESMRSPLNGHKDAQAASIGSSASTIWRNDVTRIADDRTSTVHGEVGPFLIRIDDGFMKHIHGLRVEAVEDAECLPDVDDQRIGAGCPSAPGFQTAMGETFAATLR
jgi:hypothetical protein